MGGKATRVDGDLGDLLRVGPPPGAGPDQGATVDRPVDLAAIDPDATPGFDGGKKAGKKALQRLAGEITDLQARLIAHGYTGGERRVLLVLQGMDTAGKGGAVKHAVGILDPGGL